MPAVTAAAGHGRTLRLVVFMALLAGAVLGCANDSADQQRLQDQRVEQAKRDAARQAWLEERSRAQGAEQRRLRAEIKRLQGRGGGPGKNTGGGGGGTSTPPRQAAQPTRGSVSCGDGLSVGPTTSCAFARNVQSAYLESGGGNTTVRAYSPTTGLSYTMSCSGGAPTVCTGGKNASVYIS